jgi:phosphoribosylaminoimidazole-succinocarboxamide synthase
MSAPVFESHLAGLKLLARGKVRDIYEIDAEHLLFVASDRLSAFDVVLPDPIPGKGRVLTELSMFWFARLDSLVANHLATDPGVQQVLDGEELASVRHQALVVKRLRPLPVEAIVRGYLIGSGWKDYCSSGAVSGITLAAGLAQAQELPQVIFTPSTKALAGIHDENISFDQMVAKVGGEIAEQVREVSIKIYEHARAYALTRGIIIADTKFEFAVDDHGKVVLIDEVLTPDSSRFWPADEYRTGISPPSFDKQFVRDYLEEVRWDKAPPAPHLPAEIITKTAEKYRQARRLLIGD